METNISVNRCRHVKVNGARCTMPARPRHDLCFEHNYRLEAQRRLPLPTSRSVLLPTVALVWVEDEASILHNLNLISQALGNAVIDHRQAAAMTCLMRTCLRTLRQREEFSQPDEPSEPIVTDCIEDDSGQLLVPPDPPAAPASEPAAAEPSTPLNADGSAPYASSCPPLAGENVPVTEPDPNAVLSTLHAVADLCALSSEPCNLGAEPCLTPAFPTPAPLPRVTAFISALTKPQKISPLLPTLAPSENFQDERPLSPAAQPAAAAANALAGTQVTAKYPFVGCCDREGPWMPQATTCKLVSASVT